MTLATAFLAFAAGLTLGVVIGLHAVYRQSGAEPWREPYDPTLEIVGYDGEAIGV